MKKVMIDPGHGGSDPGAVGHGMQEKDLVLMIAKGIEANYRRIKSKSNSHVRQTGSSRSLTEHGKQIHGEQICLSRSTLMPGEGQALKRLFTQAPVAQQKRCKKRFTKQSPNS